ncbi:MAG TPA: hypothetical protein VF516_12875 [Kofleriaceae bacterium]
MNTKALITTLAVLGSTSSLAMAHPTHDSAPVSVSAYASWNTGGYATEYQAPYATEYQAPIVRDHRYAPPPPPVRVRPVVQHRGGDWGRRDGWGYDGQPRETILADGLTYSAGEFRKDIDLQGRGRFNAVTLHEDDGCNFIAQVVVEFMGGAVQSIPVNRTLQPNQSMTFDLNGTNRAINRIFVYRDYSGQRNTRVPSGGDFTVAAL